MVPPEDQRSRARLFLFVTGDVGPGPPSREAFADGPCTTQGHQLRSRFREDRRGSCHVGVKKQGSWMELAGLAT